MGIDAAEQKQVITAGSENGHASIGVEIGDKRRVC
jgi:hypothetical protein